MDSVKAKKRLGQNFLTNENICKLIPSFLSCDENSKVLEIGPGHGAITKYLYEKFPNLTACELDNELIEELSKNFPNLNIVNKNVMKLDLSGYDAIIGNIPYNITTELFVKLEKDATNAKEMIFMIQKEAFERIIVAKKQEEVTPTSIIFHTFYDHKLLMNVSRENFNPKPNVDSVVFKLTRNDYLPGFSIRDYYYFLIILFSMRRKNILNNLLTKYKKEVILENLEKLGISTNTRSESLKLEDFYNLYTLFTNK